MDPLHSIGRKEIMRVGKIGFGFARHDGRIIKETRAVYEIKCVAAGWHLVPFAWRGRIASHGIVLFVCWHRSVRSSGTFFIVPAAIGNYLPIVHAEGIGDDPIPVCHGGFADYTFRLKRFDFVMEQISKAAQPRGIESEHLNFAGALLDFIPVGVIAIGPGKQILAFNAAAERFTGLHAADLLNRSIAVLPPPLQAVIDETFVTGHAVGHRDVLLSQNAGDVLLQVTTTIAHQSGGGILSVLAELQNVSQARSMAANLEHLDRLASIGVLSAGMAHEIKNALVPLRTFMDLPADQRADRELNDLVSEEIRRIDTVVRQMLRGATREEFKLAPLSFHGLLRDCLNLLRPQMQASSVKLDMKLAAASDRVNGDERQLRHAIINLLINALESMAEGGQLKVATKVMQLRERPHLRASISDTGCGISPENLARLFSPFFTTKKEGTGLGLAITRRIIQEHNGAITVENNGNEGTTFHVFLPLL